MPPQRQKHISQKVGTVVTLPVGAACAAWASGHIGCHCEATAVAPNVAAEIFRNRLRENCAMTCLSAARTHAFGAGVTGLSFVVDSISKSLCIARGAGMMPIKDARFVAD